MKTSETHEIFGHSCARRDHHDQYGERRWDPDIHIGRRSSKARSPAQKRRRATGHPERQDDLTLADALKTVLTQCPTISVDPDVMEGQPCIAGTYIPVFSVLRVIEKFGSIEEAVSRYHPLTQEQAKDALQFASLLLEPNQSFSRTDPDVDDFIDDSIAMSGINAAMSGLRAVVGAIKEGRSLPIDPSLHDLLAEVASPPRRDESDIEKWARGLAESVGNLAD